MGEFRQTIAESNITCPHCGSKDLDSWERNKKDLETDWQEIECWDCNKRFQWRRNVNINYDSESLEENE